VPFSRRRRFKYSFDAETSGGPQRPLREKLLLDKSLGSAILPSTHPNSVYVKSILERILEASGLESLDMEVILVNDPFKCQFIHCELKLT